MTLCKTGQDGILEAAESVYDKNGAVAVTTQSVTRMAIENMRMRGYNAKGYGRVGDKKWRKFRTMEEERLGNSKSGIPFVDFHFQHEFVSRYDGFIPFHSIGIGEEEHGT